VPAGKGKKGMDLFVITITANPLSFLATYTLYLPTGTTGTNTRKFCI
jgi:hypothetical protein